jgi:hypothetical protein
MSALGWKWGHAAWCGVAVSLASLRAEPLALTITAPQANQTVASVSFSARLSGVTEPVIVRVQYAGVTHFIQVTPWPGGRPPRPGMTDRFASDALLPLVRGSGELAVTVVARDGRELVPRRSVTFVVAERGASDMTTAFARARSRLNELASQSAEAKAAYLGSMMSNERRPESANWGNSQAAARRYLGARARAFHERVNAYADLAGSYRVAGRPGDALRALQEAERIFESERTERSLGPFLDGFPMLYAPDEALESPKYFGAMAELLIMQGKLDEALRWCDRASEFQKTQMAAGHFDARGVARCREHLAAVQRQIAQFDFLCRGDLAAYEERLKRAAAIATGG